MVSSPLRVCSTAFLLAACKQSNVPVPNWLDEHDGRMPSGVRPCVLRPSDRTGQRHILRYILLSKRYIAAPQRRHMFGPFLVRNCPPDASRRAREVGMGRQLHERVLRRRERGRAAAGAADGCSSRATCATSSSASSRRSRATATRSSRRSRSGSAAPTPPALAPSTRRSSCSRTWATPASSPATRARRSTRSPTPAEPTWPRTSDTVDTIFERISKLVGHFLDEPMTEVHGAFRGVGKATYRRATRRRAESRRSSSGSREILDARRQGDRRICRR